MAAATTTDNDNNNNKKSRDTPPTRAPSSAPIPIPRVAGHPIFGHLSSFRADRVGLLLRLAKSHPDIVEISMGLIRRLIVTSSPSFTNEVLTTKQSSFVKAPGLAIFLRPVLGDGLLTSEHPVHEKQRRLLAPAFAHKRIASYADTMAKRAERFATELGEGDEIDLSEAMMRLTFEIVGKTLFDAEVIGDAKAVGEALTTAMEVAITQLGSFIPLPPQIPSPMNLKYKRAVAQLDDVVYRIIRERRAENRDHGDVLSMLVEARDEADGTSMTDKQVRDEAMTLFLAGHETTANALTWTFYLLARHPEARAKMEAEIDALFLAKQGKQGKTSPPTYEDLKQLPYTLAVFKEAMRLYPPAYLLGRRVIEDVTIGDHRVKKNAIVLLNVMGIHRRPDIWPNPESFDPERFLNDKDKQLPRCSYMPFGAGPRVCIGNHFALMEGHVVLATIARHVRFELTNIDPQTKEPAVAAMEPLITLRPRNGLPVRASVRNRNPTSA